MEYIHVKNKKRNKPEKRLENWLKRNLDLFEAGLVFIKSQFRNYNKPNNGFDQIDILAVDKNKTPVIIEVKIYINRFTLDKQLLPYMKRFPQKCRGVIAAIHLPKRLTNTILPENVTLWCTKGLYNAKRPRKKS